MKNKKLECFDDRLFEEKLWDNFKDYSLALFVVALMFVMGWCVNQIITLI